MSTFIRESGKYKPYELQHRFRKRVFLLIKILFFIFILHLIISHFFLFTVSVEAEAMEPGFRHGDRVLVTPLIYGPSLPFSKERKIFSINPPERGDLVVYFSEHLRSKKILYRIADPVVKFFTLQRVRSISKMVREQYPQYMVRRVVGIPGDTVELRENEIFIRSEGQEQLVKDIGEERASQPVYGRTDFSLAEDEYFILSDNRNAGIDSRHFGPVSSSGIAGKVFFTYFPFSRFGTP